MAEPLATLAFIAVLGVTSALAFSARWFHRRDVLPHLEGWALGDRRFGTVITWFLLGGSIFTAYTFAAVPGLAYGTGALGFFPLTYTVILCPVLFVLLPRLWEAARRCGAVTVAHYVRARRPAAGGAPPPSSRWPRACSSSGPPSGWSRWWSSGSVGSRRSSTARNV